MGAHISSAEREGLCGADESARATNDVDSDEQFLRSVLASSADCIKVIDLDGNLLYMTDEGQRLMEVSDFNAIRGCPWPEFWQDGLDQHAIAAIQAARHGGEGRFEGMAHTCLGTPKWWDVRVTPIRDAHGEPRSLLVVSRDISVLKEAQSQQRLLMEELAHRVKNIIAVVQAISMMSLRDGTDIAEGREALNSRLLALSHAQDILLSNTGEVNATLAGLLSRIISIHGDANQFEIAGPEMIVGSTFALGFSLVMHELLTNALKYGALSREGGKVVVSWESAGDPENKRLEFCWAERGGPLVVTPSRKGFGSRLIERSLVKRPTSSAQVIYEPTGVIFRLNVLEQDLIVD
ncbi:hypothetical protein B0E48_02540 [Rhodanobacter sp. C03]|nr:hypothetical protein B0E48_02540 [Rhodanobacter sp. C03]